MNTQPHVPPQVDFTDAEIATLRLLWAEGHSMAEIGRRMRRSKNSIVGKVHRLFLPARPSPIRRDVVPQGPAAAKRLTGSTLPALPSEGDAA